MNIIFCIFVTQWFCEILISGGGNHWKVWSTRIWPISQRGFLQGL